ncbi:MAG: hypothetical protein ACREM9_03220 [Gemmatimonadales bacterium]
MSDRDSTPEAGPKETGRTVVGLFTLRAGAESAISDLRAAGFPRDRIGVATQDEGGTGGTLVTVDAGARTSEALAILERHKADLGPSDVTDPGV